jgi:hypothetical protein
VDWDFVNINDGEGIHAGNEPLKGFKLIHTIQGLYRFATQRLVIAKGRFYGTTAERYVQLVRAHPTGRLDDGVDERGRGRGSRV